MDDLAAASAAPPPHAGSPTPPAVSAVPATVAELLARRLATAPSAPVLTFYDDATGERAETSAVTLDNWVAKTANLVVDELLLEPGSRVRLALPLHWQTWVWLLACWRTGATVQLVAPGAESAGLAPADVVVTDVADLADLGGPQHLGGAELVHLALRPFALPSPDVPAGRLDFDSAVRSHGDRYVGPTPPPSTVLLETAAADGAAPPSALDGAGVLRLAGDAVGRWQLQPGDRLLTTVHPASPSGLAAVLGALLRDASVVLVRRPAPAAVADRLRQEAVTAVLVDDAADPGLVTQITSTSARRLALI